MTYTNWKCLHDPQIIKDYNIKETPENHIKLFDASHQYELENINHIHPYLAELTMIYYIYKNQLKSDFISITHYRREYIGINFEKLKNDAVQVLWEGVSKESFYERMINVNMNSNIILGVKSFLRNNKKMSNLQIEELLNKKNVKMMYPLSFTCNWKIFNEICDFIFYILDYILPNERWKNIDELNNYNNDMFLLFDNFYCNYLKNEKRDLIITTLYTYRNQPRFVIMMIEIILSAYIPLMYETFLSNKTTSKNIILYLDDNSTLNDLIKFYEKNCALIPNFYLVYKNDKIICNESYIHFIKDNGEYKEIFKYTFRNYELLKFCNIDEFDENTINDKIILKINEYIDTPSIDDLMNNNYQIKKIQY